MSFEAALTGFGSQVRSATLREAGSAEDCVCARAGCGRQSLCCAAVSPSQDASKVALMPMACAVRAKKRAPSCLRCHWLSTWLCLLALGIGVTQCHSWLRTWMASPPEEAELKTRTISQCVLRDKVSTACYCTAPAVGVKLFFLAPSDRTLPRHLLRHGAGCSRQVDANFACVAPHGLEEQTFACSLSDSWYFRLRDSPCTWDSLSWVCFHYREIPRVRHAIRPSCDLLLGHVRRTCCGIHRIQGFWSTKTDCLCSCP